MRPSRDAAPARATLRLDVDSEPAVVAARVAARAISRGLELSDGTATQFATAVSEVCRNAVVHAGGGRITFALEDRGRQAALVATVTDEGPGIADVDAAMTPASGRATPGVGLSRARRLVDDLRIRAGQDGGTEVSIVRSVPPGAAERWADAIAGIGASGDGPVAEGPGRARAPHDGPDMGDPSELEEARFEIMRLEEERIRLGAELEETNRGVVALYAELEDQAERLRRADELKSRFLSRVSHELRTPINSVVALSRLLADRVDGELSEGQATQVGYIRSAADELLLLVNELLDLARIESGRVEVQAREFLLDGLFGGLRGSLRPLARAGVEIQFEPADRIPPLYTDETKLAQIVRNFVSNALKFTATGAVTIASSFDAERGRVRIEVADTGIGIAADDLERIFDEFVQVPGSHQVGLKGTGLGLSVARGLAAILGGEVGARSTPGEGSVFWVELPAIVADQPRETDRSGTAAASPTVLVVDDDPTARYLVHHQLAAQGVRLVEAATGTIGLELARSERPAVVVLDLSMPDVDGIEVLARLRAEPGTSAVAIVVHTGRELTDDERRIIDGAGAAIVPKDAPPSSITAAVRAALSERPPGEHAGGGSTT